MKHIFVLIIIIYVKIVWGANGITIVPRATTDYTQISASIEAAQNQINQLKNLNPENIELIAQLDELNDFLQHRINQNLHKLVNQRSPHPTNQISLIQSVLTEMVDFKTHVFDDVDLFEVHANTNHKDILTHNLLKQVIAIIDSEIAILKNKYHDQLIYSSSFVETVNSENKKLEISRYDYYKIFQSDQPYYPMRLSPIKLRAQINKVVHNIQTDPQVAAELSNQVFFELPERTDSQETEEESQEINSLDLGLDSGLSLFAKAKGSFNYPKMFTLQNDEGMAYLNEIQTFGLSVKFGSYYIDPETSDILISKLDDLIINLYGLWTQMDGQIQRSVYKMIPEPIILSFVPEMFQVKDGSSYLQEGDFSLPSHPDILGVNQVRKVSYRNNILTYTENNIYNNEWTDQRSNKKKVENLDQIRIVQFVVDPQMTNFHSFKIEIKERRDNEKVYQAFQSESIETPYFVQPKFLLRNSLALEENKNEHTQKYEKRRQPYRIEKYGVSLWKLQSREVESAYAKKKNTVISMIDFKNKTSSQKEPILCNNIFK